MVIIRLSRGGNRNRPYYYIVVTDSHARRDGKFIEQLGFYNPIASENVEGFRCDLERVDYWVSVGAQLSPTVKSLVTKHRKSK